MLQLLHVQVGRILISILCKSGRCSYLENEQNSYLMYDYSGYVVTQYRKIYRCYNFSIKDRTEVQAILLFWNGTFLTHTIVNLGSLILKKSEELCLNSENQKVIHCSDNIRHYKYALGTEIFFGATDPLGVGGSQKHKIGFLYHKTKHSAKNLS